MKVWTIIGTRFDCHNRSVLPSKTEEECFVAAIKAMTAADAERKYVEEKRFSRIVAILEGYHPYLRGDQLKYWGEEPAETIGRQGWTFIGIDQNHRRFVAYSPGALTEQAKIVCKRSYGKDSKIIAVIAGNVSPADVDRGPILPSKIWTVCGIWELGDENQPFTDSFAAADVDETMDLIAQKQPALSIAGIFEGDHKAHDAGRATKRKAPITWTVAGIIESTGQRYAESVEANSWMDARAACEAAEPDLIVAAVLEGKLDAADIQVAPETPVMSLGR